MIDSILQEQGSTRPLSIKTMELFRQGVAFIEVPHRQKNPTLPGWQKRRSTEAELTALLADLCRNLAILPGESSGGLADVDIDHRIAVTLAPKFLSSTPMRHGRPGKPNSHLWYTAPGAKTRKYQAPDGTMLAEIRSTGCATLVPPSIHPSGEPYEWSTDAEAAAATIAADDLERQVGKLAAATLLALVWPDEGGRNEIAKALSGFLLRGGFDVEEAEDFIRAVAEAAGDPEVEVRVTCVRYTKDHLDHGDAVTGGPALAEALRDGHKVVAKLREWLGFGREASGTSYFERDVAIYKITGWKQEDDGNGGTRPIPVTRRLTNFTAQVVGEIVIDSGEGDDALERQFVIQGVKAGGMRFTCRIAASEYNSRDKLHSALQVAGGSALVVQPGAGPDLAAAILELSPSAPEERVYAHTGWTEHQGRRIYLLPGGSVVPEGDAPRVELPGGLRRYGVRAANPDDLRAGIRVVLDHLLRVFAARVSYPTVAHVFLAVIHGRLQTDQKYALHLVGETGSKKTAYAMVVLCLFGDFTDDRPPETWQSTVNSVEMVGYALKDVVFLVDDFKRATVANKSMVQLIQRYADGVGRNRLTATSEILRGRQIRGLLMTTGEDLPSGEASTLARMLPLRVGRDECQEAHLTAAQESAHLLPGVMYAYINWLDREWDGIVAREVGGFSAHRSAALANLRKTAAGGTNLGRVAANLAQNTIGWRLMLAFFRDMGALEQEEADALLDEYQRVTSTVISGIAGMVAEQRASEIFLGALRTLWATGRVAIHPTTEGAATLEIGTIDTIAWPITSSGQQFVGWCDEKGIYLLGQAAYHEVQTYLRQEGRSLDFSLLAVYDQLVSDGVVVGTGSDGKTTKLKQIHGKRHRVLHLRADALEVAGDED